MYRQVLDLYATSVDYDPKSSESIAFFKMVQNKLHYAAHGHTAAEVIYERADADAPFMGLTTFSGEMPTAQDITVAKNYLTESELKILNNLVAGYFDFAEVQAMKHNPEKVLEGSGTVSHAKAIEKAKSEYKKYQAKTLSPVEKAYLQTIKSLEKQAKSKGNKDK